MDTITFDKLLLKTAFCCMACDGHIAKDEIDLVKSLCASSNLFSNFNFQDEINHLVGRLNNEGKAFINYYFTVLSNANLSREEELILIDFALKTINADNNVEYSEIKFFKAIRSKLKSTDDEILARFQDIEQFLEEDLVVESFSTKLSKYFDSVELPQFQLIDSISHDEIKE
jgi:uncharacterized tellurite resistance protein B-like protein